MKIIIRDITDNETIGIVHTNHSMSFDEIMEIAGFDWKNGEFGEGWYIDDILYTEDDVVIQFV